ncbi:F420-0:Gamma-glutamyl ligase [Leptolyngbya sp. FACHB-36]|uniref:F420-0:Gamma-glutamyl ligase n=1 Tax=Leptolyngbya sp. FACHB-36 TaxID=2692808 RepID=UPI001681C1B9|nr:F420-0:Gamma-glutamyl ligase [Leptolyngbya sp. FACHB-36]MBD2022614.1 F420-0:Gamma-glutamyl ligase [Leptolyngbya sp. FACHB-36]
MGTLESIVIGIVAAIVLLVALALLAIELQFRRRPGNRLELTSENWELEVYEPQHYVIAGEMTFCNRTQRLEIMVPEVRTEVKLLSSGTLDGITTTARVIPRHKDAGPRPDDYWYGYIVKVGKVDPLEVVVDIQGPDLSQLTIAWVQIHYITYGPQGRVPNTRHVIVPLKFPAPEDSKAWRPATNADVLPIRTHLLTPLDHPVEVVKRYVLPHAQPGDVVTIGESPVAIMQERFRHPSELKPGWVARRLCYLFLPTSSLATACGLQTLVDIVGPTRVLFAFLAGSVAKVLGKPGVFYQLAGEQARLIDDVTGTIPPYDQFIVLGPANPQQIVDQIRRETGLSAAIVDVNDLRAVKILAATSDIESDFLKQALLKNPAGNADEQTPVVLVRPAPSKERLL